MRTDLRTGERMAPKAWNKRRQTALYITERIRLSLNTQSWDSCREPGTPTRRLAYDVGTLQRFDSTSNARHRATSGKSKTEQGISKVLKTQLVWRLRSGMPLAES